jgi:hypothetical protein
MAAYKVRVTDDQGRLVVGATLYCATDAAARERFEQLPLPHGVAELSLRGRVIVSRGVDFPLRANGK